MTASWGESNGMLRQHGPNEMTQATCVTLNFLVAILQERREEGRNDLESKNKLGELNFNDTLRLTQSLFIDIQT